MRMTPEQEAAYALDYGVSRADLKPQVQTVYDRLLEERRAAAAAGQPPLRDQTAGPGAAPARAAWQGSPLPPRRFHWPALLLGAAGFAFVAAFIVGGYGGPDMGDAANRTAALLFLLALVALCAAVPAALYRRYRSRRTGAGPQAKSQPFAPCYRCGYPLAVHSGDDMKCPEAGMCDRCGEPFAGHIGYELTCPAPSSA